MAKFIEFPVVMGRLGNHPGLLGPLQAQALFNAAMACGQGAHFLDYWPDGGRSTVVLFAASQNVEGQLEVLTNWQYAPQGAQPWYDRAIMNHKVKLAEHNGHSPDMAVVSTEVIAVAIDALRSIKKLFVYGPVQALELPGFKVAEQGAGWALYCAE